MLLPVGSARLRINMSEAKGGCPGKLSLECAIAREAVQQDQALRACMLRNMSTVLTRWVYLIRVKPLSFEHRSRCHLIVILCGLFLGRDRRDLDGS